MWTSSIVSASIIASVLLAGSMFRCATLERKLWSFRYSLLVLIPTLVALGIAYVTEVNVSDPTLAVVRDGNVEPAWYAAVAEAHHTTELLLAGLLGMLMLLAVQLVSLVSQLRSFIVTQEVDLVARDQAALHAANQAAAAATCAC